MTVRFGRVLLQKKKYTAETVRKKTPRTRWKGGSLLNRENGEHSLWQHDSFEDRRAKKDEEDPIITAQTFSR